MTITTRVEPKPYVVLARKWRSVQFKDVVGQAHVVRTLSNAIRTDRVHQAYLMTGSRGIGKTSIARIFAKALRCEHRTVDSETVLSCEKCSNCLEISKGISVDVIEIDGASNNGVDAVREIRDAVKFSPSHGRYKIYVIDEVHMLTHQAFNALLKTLEEPPAHVVFILATTEPHKIPATVLSRCQRFDLKRISPSLIESHLVEIMKAENLQADSAALALISKAAEGSMRDALSLLDQSIAYASGKLTSQAVREAIGLIHADLLLDLTENFLKKDVHGALVLAQSAYDQGFDLKILNRSLIETMHLVILTKVIPDFSTLGGKSGGDLSGWSQEEQTRARKLSELRPLEDLELIFQVFQQGSDWISRAPNPKIVLDLLIIKVATADMLVPVTKIESQKEVQAQPQVQVMAPVAPALASTPQKSVSVDAPKGKSWESFVAFVKQKRPLLGSMLEYGIAEISEANSQLIVRFDAKDQYYREQLQAKPYQDELLKFTQEYYSLGLKITQGTQDKGQVANQVDSTNQRESLADKRDREKLARESAVRDTVRNHPLIQEAKSLFGGELGPIELSELSGKAGPKE